MQWDEVGIVSQVILLDSLEADTLYLHIIKEENVSFMPPHPNLQGCSGHKVAQLLSTHLLTGACLIFWAALIQHNSLLLPGI